MSNTIDVLIIEDSPERISFFKGLYKYSNCSFADNLRDAIELLQSSTFNIIHLDYDLADGFNSEKAAELIRSSHSNAVIIIHSENPQGVERLLEIVPDGYPIPFTVIQSKNELSNRFKAALNIPGKQQFSRIREILQPYFNK